MPKKPSPKPASEPATLTLEEQLKQQQQERVNRAKAAVDEICKRENVVFFVASLDLTLDGRISPQIGLRAL